ncbi:MAG: hypothetical protein IAA25_03120 [Candidatus Ruminococcus intestinipullorum]|nr:hypothetical protein [Candidatus Ruminococcus intestinipullorum]
MKQAVMGFFLMICFIFIGAILYTAEMKTTRKNELDTILGTAMEQSMELLTINSLYQISDEKGAEELVVDFIQNFLSRTTSDSDFQIRILTVDEKRGLLDVEVTEIYKQMIGQGRVVSRKTIVLEDIEKEQGGMCKVSFWRENEEESKKIVKQIMVPKGSLLSASMLPKIETQAGEQILGWRVIIGMEHGEEDTIYTEETVGEIHITEDMEFEVVKILQKY